MMDQLSDVTANHKDLREIKNWKAVPHLQGRLVGDVVMSSS
jgi:hypothetical protein